MKKETSRKKSLLALICLLLCTHLAITAQTFEKREFRGAWIQCVNGQFMGMRTQQMQDTLTRQLDELKKDGVNAIIFQVRPECDALYKSDIEPWSRFLTGRQGQAPSPWWDPLQWMIEQCHRRGMELHAWINPFRAKTKTTQELSAKHIAIRRPGAVFNYDGQMILNPALPENRDYICKVVKDIVSRYDVDGLHIDDYFYPYPAPGLAIPDDREYAAYSKGRLSKADWRRENVNVFIKQLSETIHKTKPWVKFGVSPFGIYRNKKNDPKTGSATNGLQNYDDLYADVLLWVEKGWIDYCVPQLYWQIGHKAADYATLINWWNKHASKRHLYIGEDVERTVKFADVKNPSINQMPAKFNLHRQMKNVNGTVLWYAKAVVDNTGNYGTMLRNVYWKYPALPPVMSYIDGKAPKKVRKVKVLAMNDGKTMLFWSAPKGKSWKNEAVRYVVYRFDNGEKVNTSDPSKIVAITGDMMYELPTPNQTVGKGKMTFAVTALNRMSNESKPKKKTIKY